LAGRTRNSIPELARLASDLARVRQCATARDDEELEVGMRGRAAGILDDQDKLVAGLLISAPTTQLKESWQKLSSLGPILASAPQVRQAPRETEGQRGTGLGHTWAPRVRCALKCKRPAIAGPLL
jgi:DNA-binding IclR family transcriptional regulator